MGSPQSFLYNLTLKLFCFFGIFLVFGFLLPFLRSFLYFRVNITDFFKSMSPPLFFFFFFFFFKKKKKKKKKKKNKKKNLFILFVLIILGINIILVKQKFIYKKRIIKGLTTNIIRKKKLKKICTCFIIIIFPKNPNKGGIPPNESIVNKIIILDP